MKVKYLANLLDRTVKPVNVASETEKTYTVEGGVPRHKQTKYDALFSREINAQIYLINDITHRKNKYRTMYQNAQKDLLDALVRFGLVPTIPALSWSATCYFFSFTFYPFYRYHKVYPMWIFWMLHAKAYC